MSCGFGFNHRSRTCFDIGMHKTTATVCGGKGYQMSPCSQKAKCPASTTATPTPVTTTPVTITTERPTTTVKSTAKTMMRTKAQTKTSASTLTSIAATTATPTAVTTPPVTITTERPTTTVAVKSTETTKMRTAAQTKASASTLTLIAATTATPTPVTTTPVTITTERPTTTVKSTATTMMRTIARTKASASASTRIAATTATPTPVITTPVTITTERPTTIVKSTATTMMRTTARTKALASTLTRIAAATATPAAVTTPPVTITTERPTTTVKSTATTKMRTTTQTKASASTLTRIAATTATPTPVTTTPVTITTERPTTTVKSTATTMLRTTAQTKASASTLTPIDGNWSPWTSVPCTVTCGTGVQAKIRSCLNPAPQNGGTDCVGPAVQTDSCDTLTPCISPWHPCGTHTLCATPVDGQWSAWTKLPCSVTCGVGEQAFIRSCNNPAPEPGGKTCIGNDTKTEKCDTTVPCVIDGAWGTWSSWSTCPVTCGEGHERRHRTCNNPAPQNGGLNCTIDESTEKRTCASGQCPPGAVICQKSDILMTIAANVSVNHQGELPCPDTNRHRPESLLEAFCAAPSKSQWRFKSKVRTNCTQNPLFQPVGYIDEWNLGGALWDILRLPERRVQKCILQLALILQYVGNFVVADNYCLNCYGAAKPRDCNIVTLCQSHSHCYVEKYIDTVGVFRYNMGCRDTQICAKYTRNGLLFGKRTVKKLQTISLQISSKTRTNVTERNNSLINGNYTKYSGVEQDDTQNVVVCTTCCHGDLCNSGGCGETGYPNNSGPVCFDCYQMASPDRCNKVAVCEKDEVCELTYTFLFGEPVYATNCVSKHICEQRTTLDIGPYTNSALLLGRRHFQPHPHSHPPPCRKCCSSELCNVDNCTTASPFHAASHRPVDGMWGAWSAWSSTGFTCGADVRTRNRSCNHPAPANHGANCVGSPAETDHSCVFYCLSCKNAAKPSYCNVVELCQSPSQCYIDQYVDTVGDYRYNLGCRAMSKCTLQMSQPGTRSLDSTHVHATQKQELEDSGTLRPICSQCCSGNVCNTAGCGSTGVVLCEKYKVFRAVFTNISGDHPSEVPCPDTNKHQPESLLEDVCAAPSKSQWHFTSPVLTNCKETHLYEPVGYKDTNTLTEHYGIFFGCLDDGFKILEQNCTHRPSVVNIVGLDASKYRIISW